MDKMDFFSRIRSFSEAFGPGGTLALVILALVITAITLWRGTGLVLFILFITYSVGAITQGGVLFVSTMVRWACLFLLGIGFLKEFHLPKPSMFLFFFYALLAVLFIAFSPYPTIAIQQGALLIMTVICVTIASNSYIKSEENIRRIFKMGIVAGGVWTLVSAAFIGEFMYSADTRFVAEGTAGTGTIAYAGAFFAPMIVWGVLQKRDFLWRILSATVIIPFVFLLLLTGMRSAIFGMLGIAIFPLLFMRGKPLKACIQVGVIILLFAGSLVIISILMPAKSEYLIGRIFDTSTTGRSHVWKAVFAYVLRNPFIGHGIAAAGIDGIRVFGLQFHNSYLAIWYNTGIIGLLSVLMFLGIYFLKSFQLIRIAPTEEIGDFARIAFGYMLGIAAMNMMESSLAGPGRISVTMLLIMAVMVDRLKQIIQEQSCYEYIDDNQLLEVNHEGFTEDILGETELYY